MRERIGILADYRLIVRALKLDSEFEYLFVATPNFSQNQDDEWGGEINEIKKECEKFVSIFNDKQERSIKKQDEEIKELKNQIFHIRETQSMIQGDVRAIHGAVGGGQNESVQIRNELKELKQLLVSKLKNDKR